MRRITQSQHHGFITDCSLSVPDGKVCLNKLGELAVTKFAVEPVSWQSYVIGTEWADQNVINETYKP